jgi:hypothetical protein
VSARDVNDTPILSLHPAICSEPSLDFHYDFSVIASLAYEVSTLYREIEKKELSNAALRSIKDVASSLQQQEQRDGASTSGSETTEDSATSSFTESASDGAASNDIHAGETTFFSSATQCSVETKLSEIASIGQVMALSSTPRYVVQLPASSVMMLTALFVRPPDCWCQVRLLTRFFKSTLPSIASRRPFLFWERLPVTLRQTRTCRRPWRKLEASVAPSRLASNSSSGKTPNQQRYLFTPLAHTRAVSLPTLPSRSTPVKKRRPPGLLTRVHKIPKRPYRVTSSSPDKDGPLNYSGVPVFSIHCINTRKEPRNQAVSSTWAVILLCTPAIKVI